MRCVFACVREAEGRAGVGKRGGERWMAVGEELIASGEEGS